MFSFARGRRVALSRHLGVLAFAASASCLDRPVVPITPGSSGTAATKVLITKIDKLDLLLVVDNSISMADKQSELGRRMPELIAALTDPTPDPKTGKPNNVPDIHVAVITSALGSYGTAACQPHIDDGGHLLPRAGDKPSGGFKLENGQPVPATCPALTAASPLTWVYVGTKVPAAQFEGYPAGAESLQIATACAVTSAGENGCPFEATWEAIRRFLIDPAPYKTARFGCKDPMVTDCATKELVTEGLDKDILVQRNAFLRDDSLVGIIVLSDENDFSWKVSAQNWIPLWDPTNRTLTARGWAKCATLKDDLDVENDVLKTEHGCTSCALDDKDPNCAVPWDAVGENVDSDRFDLRGFNQVQRFGYSFLWPRSRYVAALTPPQTPPPVDPKNKQLFTVQRGLDKLVVAAIVGVPAQLLDEADGKPKPQPLDDAAWKKLVGPIAERDPHMIESIAPRAGITEYTGDRSVDAINYGDHKNLQGDDLQYACVGPRQDTKATGDCDLPSKLASNPLCDAATGTQPYFKAYPGLRHLRIVKELGASGYVASICAKSYSPAIQGISAKLKAALSAQCVTTNITPSADGNVGCLVIEAMKADTFLDKKCEDIAPGLCTPGAAPCRRADDPVFPPLSAALAAAQLTLTITVTKSDGTRAEEPTTATVENGNVVVVGSDKQKHRVCELLQLAGGRVPADQTDKCVNDPKFDLASGGGWCFSNVPAVVGEACLAKKAQSTIRFFGGADARNGSEVFTLCTR